MVPFFQDILSGRLIVRFTEIFKKQKFIDVWYPDSSEIIRVG